MGEVILGFQEQNTRVENQAGESRVGCGCTHPAVTAAGIADCRTVLRGVLPFQTDAEPLSFGWVAIGEFLER